MQFKYTKHQVARGALPDAKSGDKIYLIKNVSRMRATYQVRLLAFMATETRRKLVILVPKSCEIDQTLRELMKLLPKTVQISHED